MHLFVYGSLRSNFHHSAFKFIGKYFTFVSGAKVKGLLYDLGDYPAALPTTAETFITGELYKAKKADDFAWAIKQLDVYEEVDSEECKVPLYRRELTEVIFNNTTIMAWIYWYNRILSEESLILSGDIMDVIRSKSKS